MFDLITADLKFKQDWFLSQKSWFTKNIRIFLEPGTIASIVYRYGNWTRTVSPNLLKLLVRIPYFFAKAIVVTAFGIYIPSKAKIGKGFTIHNFSGIFISEGEMGENVIVFQGVTIGHLRGQPAPPKIGNNVLLKNSLIGNNTNILDGAVVGKKGFGFFPGNKNIRYPHIGAVIIGDNVEIGCNNTIDRGSLSNTVIGDGTFLDNQVHIAHNVKIGKNCIITGQVGFAGSSSIGNNVMIGGQAGISGHLRIGDNVQIGGGSGVIKDIPSNIKVMGYPAKNIRNFLRENKTND